MTGNRTPSTLKVAAIAAKRDSQRERVAITQQFDRLRLLGRLGNSLARMPIRPTRQVR